MTNLDVPRAYEVIDDPVELRIAIRELARVRLWIDQLGDLAAETPGVGPEQVRAIRSTVVVVRRLSERAEARLRMLTTPVGNGGLGRWPSWARATTRQCP